MRTERYLFVVPAVLIISSFISHISGFNVGVKSTKCDDENNPCASLYSAICQGGHCKCPPGTFEDKALTTCKTGKSPKKKKEDFFDDLPLEYVPGAKPQPKPDAGAGGGGSGSPSSPRQPPPKPPGPPPQMPRQPPPPKPKEPAPQGDPKIGEKAGGGVGGALGLIAVVALVYFKCCKGGKGKEMMGKLPFFGGGGGGAGQTQAGTGAQYQMSNQQQAPAGV